MTVLGQDRYAFRMQRRVIDVVKELDEVHFRRLLEREERVLPRVQQTMQYDRYYTRREGRVNRDSWATGPARRSQIV